MVRPFGSRAQRPLLPLALLAAEGWCPAGAALPELVVISSGPEGADHGGLRAARAAGVKTKGFYRENDPDAHDWVIKQYKLLPQHSYRAKDEANAAMADFTLAIRPNLPETGTGTEKNLNTACFGFRQAASEFSNKWRARGPLHVDLDPPSGHQQFVAPMVAHFKAGAKYKSLPNTQLEEDNKPLDLSAKLFTETIPARISGMVFVLVSSESTDPANSTDFRHKVGVDIPMPFARDQLWKDIPACLTSEAIPMLLGSASSTYANASDVFAAAVWPEVGSAKEVLSGPTIKIIEHNTTLRRLRYQVAGGPANMSYVGHMELKEHEANAKAAMLRWVLDFAPADLPPNASADLLATAKGLHDFLNVTEEGRQWLPPEEKPRLIAGTGDPSWFLPPIGLVRASELLADAICEDYRASTKPEFGIFVTGSYEARAFGMMHTTEVLLTRALLAVKRGCDKAEAPEAPFSREVIAVIIIIAALLLVGIAAGAWKAALSSNSSPQRGSLIEDSVELQLS